MGEGPLAAVRRERARLGAAAIACEVREQMPRYPANSPRADLAVGTSIEVRGHFRGEWSRGFEVAEQTQEGYWVRRLSDRCVLPVEFLGRDVRAMR